MPFGKTLAHKMCLLKKYSRVKKHLRGKCDLLNFCPAVGTKYLKMSWK